MKIKHFQGYGSVTAKKKSRTVTPDNKIKLIIEVTGNHECGLVREDPYDLFNWLVSKFDKSIENYRQIENVNIETKSVTLDNKLTDQAIYTFTIRKD